MEDTAGYILVAPCDRASFTGRLGTGAPRPDFTAAKTFSFSPTLMWTWEIKRIEHI